MKSKTIFILYKKPVTIFNYLHLHLFAIIYSKQNPVFGKLVLDAYSKIVMVNLYYV